MFFKQVRRNAAKNRKGNGLFYGSLIIAVVAFYTLLSLEKQDVMRFLATIESDAVRRLMMLLPMVYLLSLFFVFFLVYFACRYQMDSRRREFGMYLMLGMTRARLFFTIFCETLWNSLVSLLIGMPAALLLTEGVSLTTAKLVGLGLIGHQFSLSSNAILWTICGFVAVQILSMLILCIPLGRAEPARLLRSDAAERQSMFSRFTSTGFLIAGILLLLSAYYLGLCRLDSLYGKTFLALLLSGILGTFLFYRGLGGFLGERLLRNRSRASGLTVFTARQIHENVLNQHKSLAVASLLLLMALACTSFGIAIGLGRTAGSRSADFSLFGSEQEINAFLAQEDVRDCVETDYPMYLSRTDVAFDAENFKKILREKVDNSEQVVEYMHMDYVISESSYNDLRRAMGKSEIALQQNQAALYTSIHRDETAFYDILNQAIQHSVDIGIQGERYSLLPVLYSDNVVADRSITIYMALIVPDDLYAQLAQESAPYCRNLHLSKELTQKRGLLQSIQEIGRKLDHTSLLYDSYLGGIGRNLFYTVAASYLTVYLGILFLLIANTVIGLKYLIGQRQNKHRYRTLLMLGADVEAMCQSVKKQINAFFFLALGVATANSIVAILAMFTNLTRLPAGTSIISVLLLAGIALLAFTGTEIIYIRVVRRTACREIRTLDITDRG